MASTVDICNLALSHLGDVANVASIDPPDGSVQAGLCARFYPIARDSMLETHTWSFAVKRQSLSLVDYETSSWDYAYAVPSDAMTVIAVQPAETEDDYSTRFAPSDTLVAGPVIAAGAYVPRRFTIEINGTGQRVILTDEPNAIVRYTSRATDATQFPSTFVIALSWSLASMLAGPIIKGDEGAAQGMRCTRMAAMYLSEARTMDANQSDTRPEHIVTWMANR